MSRHGDPWGCHEDYLNEQIAEAMHAAHLEDHEAYPQKGCEWCEAEEEAEQEANEEALIAWYTCPRCVALVVPGFYCIECGWVPPRKEGEK